MPDGPNLQDHERTQLAYELSLRPWHHRVNLTEPQQVLINRLIEDATRARAETRFREIAQDLGLSSEDIERGAALMRHESERHV